jgi:hypothetical protein
METSKTKSRTYCLNSLIEEVKGNPLHEINSDHKKLEKENKKRLGNL